MISVHGKDNNKFFFEELQYINTLRNRIAHQEPICFSHVTKEIDLTYIRKQYQRIMMLFGYMGIDGARLLKGLDDFGTVCKGIKRLEKAKHYSLGQLSCK